ncbi:hypothetical protein GEV33_000590 [Tenebrio molitor]|jgi:hypothetical protein|uniref:LIM zinc-binding domain-containing protein n=1 Tax=Tenebrio molitor TaxID=7067 RepID=A0A8J6LQW4_TENMO|nr:hypothetical protein GEV33_000590 [Tenebrio molitor]
MSRRPSGRLSRTTSRRTVTLSPPRLVKTVSATFRNFLSPGSPSECQSRSSPATVEMLKERESIERAISSPCSGLGGPAVLDGTTCAGCGGRIQDRYYLLAVDRQWHAACLKCCECKLPLDTELTCFARDGNIYCKEDYYR